MEQRISEYIKSKLQSTVKRIFADGRGIMATDESASTFGKKFKPNGISNTEEMRRKFRLLLYNCENLEKYVGGVILNEEAFSQADDGGRHIYHGLKDRNICIGVKLDKGTVERHLGGDERGSEMPGSPNGGLIEKISTGLADLEQRLRRDDYREASFTKWRALFYINGVRPTEYCTRKNLKSLCKFALLCQRNGLVPIVEPELYWEGSFTLERMKTVARNIYSKLIYTLSKRDVFLPGIILKLSFITPGRSGEEKPSLEEIGRANMEILRETIPPAVGGVVFLSGGHSSTEAVEYLHEIKKQPESISNPISFSFARAITSDVIETWRGKEENNKEAENKLLDTLKMCKNANRK